MAIFDFLEGIGGALGLGGGGGSSGFQPTFLSTGDVFSQAGSLLPQLAASEVAYNEGFLPLIGLQKRAEAEAYPGLAPLREDLIGRTADELSFGSRLSPEMENYLAQKTAEQLGASGIGGVDAGQRFGIRSLLSAGIDLGERRRAEAGGLIRSFPSLNQIFPTRQPFGDTAGLTLAQDIGNTQAAINNYGMLQERERKSSFTSLLSTGARLLGMAGGGFLGSAGGPLGTLAGITAGGEIAGSIFGGGQQRGGGSILDGLGGLIGGPKRGIGSQSPTSRFNPTLDFNPSLTY